MGGVGFEGGMVGAPQLPYFADAATYELSHMRETIRTQMQQSKHERDLYEQGLMQSVAERERLGAEKRAAEEAAEKFAHQTEHLGKELQKTYAEVDRRASELLNARTAMDTLALNAEADHINLMEQIAAARRAKEAQERERDALDVKLVEAYTKAHAFEKEVGALRVNLEATQQQADAEQDAMLARLRVEKQARDEIAQTQMHTEVKLQEVAQEAAKMGTELLQVYQEFGSAQESNNIMASRMIMLEKGVQKQQQEHVEELAEARAATEGMYIEYEKTHKTLSATTKDFEALNEELTTTKMAKKYLELEKEVAEKRLEEVASECETLRAELIGTGRLKDKLLEEVDTLKVVREQQKRETDTLKVELDGERTSIRGLLEDNHKLGKSLQQAQEDLEKALFECKMLKDQRDDARADAKQCNEEKRVAVTSLSAELKGQKEITAATLMEKERALAAMQKASDDAALMKFELATLAHEAVQIDPYHPITNKHHDLLRKMPEY